LIDWWFDFYSGTGTTVLEAEHVVHEKHHEVEHSKQPIEPNDKPAGAAGMQLAIEAAPPTQTDIEKM
jgi:hypothetical protein